MNILEGVRSVAFAATGLCCAVAALIHGLDGDSLLSGVWLLCALVATKP